MRHETILDIMKRIKNEQLDFKSGIEREVIGTTVLTAYNNKTYRIGDINYSKKPTDRFETKNGWTTFIDYYRIVSLAKNFLVFV